MKVLIIDDEQRIRDLFRLWLEREGWEVYAAENGRDGVRLQQIHQAEIVICDLLMPVQEGIETITQFRQDFPDTGIIAISGGGRIDPTSYLSVAEQFGAWRVFSKPVDMPSLIEAIKEWQNKK